jgi:methionine--tRNA ligase beta chain
VAAARRAAADAAREKSLQVKAAADAAARAVLREEAAAAAARKAAAAAAKAAAAAAEKEAFRKQKADADAAAQALARAEAAAALRTELARGIKEREGLRGDLTASEEALCDLRVGKIVKVWPHPEAERLFCEEIDVGEGAPRQIASGLREHYKLEELQGRAVVVACNLKPRPLVGFNSNGMVLAATSAAGKVEWVSPPLLPPRRCRVRRAPTAPLLPPDLSPPAGCSTRPPAPPRASASSLPGTRRRPQSPTPWPRKSTLI